VRKVASVAGTEEVGRWAWPAEVAASLERMHCHREAATELPKEGQSRTLAEYDQEGGMLAERMAGKAELTSLRAKREAQRRLWEVESDRMTRMADWSQAADDVVSWCGQNQSRPVRVVLWERKAEVVGSGVTRDEVEEMIDWRMDAVGERVTLQWGKRRVRAAAAMGLDSARRIGVWWRSG
jgi:hypothetical protein